MKIYSISENFQELPLCLAKRILKFMYSRYVIAKDPKTETSQTLQKRVSDARLDSQFSFTIMQAF